MKKVLILLGLATSLTLTFCSTPQPGTTPDNTNTGTTVTTDTTVRDTTRQQPLF